MCDSFCISFTAASLFKGGLYERSDVSVANTFAINMIIESMDYPFYIKILLVYVLYLTDIYIINHLVLITYHLFLFALFIHFQNCNLDILLQHLNQENVILFVLSYHLY